MTVSKKSQSLKRYLYISQRKIGMYDSQRSRNWLQRLVERISRISHFKYKDIELDIPAEDEISQYQKMQEIIERLEK